MGREWEREGRREKGRGRERERGGKGERKRGRERRDKENRENVGLTFHSF